MTSASRTRGAPQERPPGRISKIFLVGFMGAGKTTLGHRLAGRLAWAFEDLDRLIEEAEGVSIPRIFETRGEAVFREVEARILARIASRPGTAVVACGGGTFASKENQALIHRHGVSVWIDRPFERIWSLGEKLSPSRPLLRDESAARLLYEERLAFYSSAMVRLRVEDATGPEALEALLELVNGRCDLEPGA